MSHKPTEDFRRMVQTMAGYGIRETGIAAVLQISPAILRKYYREELDTGQFKANSTVAEHLFQIATGGGPKAVTACIFWLKCRAGWVEARQEEGKKEKQQ